MGKKFSSFIIKSLMLFMGVSFVLVAAGIYIVQSYKIEAQGNSIFEIAQKGFSESLTDHLGFLTQRLEETAVNPQFRRSLIDGDHTALSNIVAHMNIPDSGFEVHFHDQRNAVFIPPLPEDLTDLQPIFQTLVAKEGERQPLINVGNQFITLVSHPVMEDTKRIGTIIFRHNLDGLVKSRFQLTC